MVRIHYLFYYFLFRNIQTKIKKCILKFCCIYFSFTSCLCCLMSCCLDGVSWPLARGSFAYLGYFFFIIFCCVLIWNIQTKIVFWNFDVFLARGIGQWVPASPIALTLLVGLLPRWGLMASCPRIFCLMPISAIKKFNLSKSLHFFVFQLFFLFGHKLPFR